MPSPEKFNKTLKEFNIDSKIINQINNGYEELTDSSPKKLRAEYFKKAIDLLDESIPFEQEIELMDCNACCKGGKRLTSSKQFFKEHKDLPLAEKLQAIPSVPYMGKPELINDHQIRIAAVEYYYNDTYHCACPNYNGVKINYKVSRNYCLCCAGHFRFHYEIMLGVKLKLAQIETSPFDHDGKEPCVFLFDINE